MSISTLKESQVFPSNVADDSSLPLSAGEFLILPYPWLELIMPGTHHHDPDEIRGQNNGGSYISLYEKIQAKIIYHASFMKNPPGEMLIIL